MKHVRTIKNFKPIVISMFTHQIKTLGNVWEHFGSENKEIKTVRNTHSKELEK